MTKITKSLICTMACAFHLGAFAQAPESQIGVPVAGGRVSGKNILAQPGQAALPDGKFRLGERNPLVPPFVETFEGFPQGSERAEFERRFQVIDSNDDTRSWGLYNYSDDFYSPCAYLLYPMENGNSSGIVGRATADDWLIPRAIKLEGGKYYNVNMLASLFVDGTEHKFEVKMGEYNDAEGMVYEVIPPTPVNTKARKYVKGWFKAPDDGRYYLGIHAISERSKCVPGYLFVDNIAIDAPRNGGEPDYVTGIHFTNDPNGTTKVEIAFSLPTTSISGNALDGTVDVTVKRGDVLVATLTGRQPGEKVTVEDDPKAEGTYNYSFVAGNAAGDGCAESASNYAGFAAPVSPAITSIEEVSEGRVALTWTAPDRDLNGNAINPDLLTYNVYDYSTEELVEVATGVTGTSHTIDVPLLHGGQTFAVLVVTASFNGVESAPVASNAIVVGVPYKFPYRYSFVESMTEENVLSSESDEGVSWRLLDDYSDPKAQDGDGGYICMIGNAPDKVGEFSTGKLDLTHAKYPYASIYTYVYPEDENEVSVSVVDCATKEKRLVKTFYLGDFKRMGWTRLVVPINAYAGKVVRLCFKGKIVTHGYVPFDNLAVDDLKDVDLGVDLLSYSRYAAENEEYVVEAGVVNMGYNTVSNYEVRLMCDGKCVDAVTGCTPLASMESAVATLRGKFSSASPTMPSFSVEVVADGDMDTGNNATKPFSITFLAPNHPVPGNLEAAEQDNVVTLTWSAPDLSKAAPEESFEDFESYPAFTTDLGKGWSMYDGDRGYVAGYNQLEFPLQNTQQAWWTMTNEYPYDYIETLGNSSLVQMASLDKDGRPVVNDDWLISPELYGGPQVVEFWARSLTIDYGYETFDIQYSTTDNNPSSFRQIMHETQLDDAWTQMFVTLPRGTRYFAIRCTSEDRFHMLLDNITYTAKGMPRPYVLKGYNVYRNGNKVNDGLVTECSFSTTRELEGDVYFVTAVYDRGESVASNVAGLGNVGIGQVTDDARDNAAPAVYFDLHGAKVPAASLRPGVYLRRQGTEVTKVLVR